MRMLALVGVLFASLAQAQEAEAKPLPQPKELDGKRIVGMAAFEGRVGAVAAYDDGEWRDPDDLAALEASALLFDPKAKPVLLAELGVWFQPIRKNYRGREGWQKLRWGMTTAETRAAIGGTEVKPDKGFQLAARIKTETGITRADCRFADGRLALVAVRIEGMSFDGMKGLLVAKYGEPKSESLLSARWERPESSIALTLSALKPVAFFASTAFSIGLKTGFDAEQKKEADESL